MGFITNGKRVVEFLDATGGGYVRVAKEYSTIKSAVQRTPFTVLEGGWEYGEFSYQPKSWTLPHRFVVVRRPIPEDPQEAQQLSK